MLRSIRKWIHASRVRRIAAGAAGVAMLAIGALLAFNALTAPTLPDPRTATEAEVIAFLKDDYHRASSAQREALIQGLAQRIGEMTEAERRAFNERWRASGQDPRIRRQIAARIWSAFIRQFAQEYRDLPDQERRAYLDQLLTTIQFIGGSDKFMDWLDGNPLEAAIRQPEQFSGDLLHWDLSISTSAEERADLVQLGGDLLERAKQRGMR